MALGTEQPRKDKFTWLLLMPFYNANTFYTDDCMLISNTAQPKGRGCFDSLTMVVINYISHLSSGQSFRIFPSPQTPVVEDIFGGSVRAAPRQDCCRSTCNTFHLTPILRKRTDVLSNSPLGSLMFLPWEQKGRFLPRIPQYQDGFGVWTYDVFAFCSWATEVQAGHL